jgi:tryptophan synthase alpha chain
MRYARTFERLLREGRGAVVPFAVLGDPTPEGSLAAIRELALAGADALELGLPFSDPIADGPVIQAAATRALEAGSTVRACFSIVRKIRGEFPEVPIGLLVYANLVLHRDPNAFYREAAEGGVDSVLVADLPADEAPPIATIARAHGVAPVLIAPPNADRSKLRLIAELTAGYTYVTARPGITGADERSDDRSSMLRALRELGAPPPLMGFGISTPEQARRALTQGAAGVICGSAVVQRIHDRADAAGFVRAMRSACRAG